MNAFAWGSFGQITDFSFHTEFQRHIRCPAFVNVGNSSSVRLQYKLASYFAVCLSPVPDVKYAFFSVRSPRSFASGSSTKWQIQGIFIRVVKGCVCVCVWGGGGGGGYWSRFTKKKSSVSRPISATRLYTRKAGLTLEVSIDFDFHLVTWPWWRTLTNESDAKYVPVFPLYRCFWFLGRSFF